ncbi:MAG: energy-coupling factor ABC transporter permease [Coriobacteriia bacterium]|nr:energy-coupling factor ABC transporter permease [Coriobacteriia bacterium]
MSHIHIPDGVLPPWLWIAGWLLALGVVALAGRGRATEEQRRKVPLLGVVSALMLVSMSSEIVPIAYHINLTVVGGALLGPRLAVVAAFIIEVVLAMLGHGGVTVLGLNTLMISGEMVLGWALFTSLRRLLRGRVAPAAGSATVGTLAVTTTLLVGLVALAGGGEATARETGALDPRSLTFEAPFAEGVLSVGLLAPEEEDAEEERGALSVRRFATVVYTLGPIGWVIEAAITAGVLGFVARVRPALLEGGGGRRGPLGDEQVKR